MTRPVRLASRLAAGSLTTISLVASPAAAQPSKNTAIAEALFQEGRELLEQGKTAEACEKLAASLKLERALGTLLNLAVCHEKQSRTATAWAEFGELATLAARGGHKPRERFARKHQQALEKRLSWLALDTSQNDGLGLEVLVDGTAIDAAALEGGVPLDPGEHRIEVRAWGREPWAENVLIAEGPSKQSLTVPLLEKQESPDPSHPPTLEPDEPEAEKGPTDEDSSYVSPLLVVGASVGGAALVVGTITGVVTLSRRDDVLAGCDADNVCPEDRRDDHAEATTLANVSNVSFAIAGAGLVVAVVGLFLSDFDGAGDATAEASVITPVVGPSFVGVSGTF